jgi:Effector Associated Constant Component 1
LDTFEPPPSTALLSAEDAKARLRDIVEGFFFRRRNEQGQPPGRHLLVRRWRPDFRGRSGAGWGPNGDRARRWYPSPTRRRAPLPGQRGEPITLGVLALALITSGTVKALIECLKAYLSRERALTIKFARADGTQGEVTARNVNTPAIREALEAMASARSG